MTVGGMVVKRCSNVLALPEPHGYLNGKAGICLAYGQHRRRTYEKDSSDRRTNDPDTMIRRG